MNPMAFAAFLAAAAAQENPPDNFTDAKVMLRANCHAGSKIEDEEALGGFWKSDNLPRPQDPDRKVEEGRIQLIAEPEAVTVLGERRGMRLLLVNATKGTAAFDASDSRLSIVQEAKDEKGDWRPVEYLPSSW